MNAGRIWANLTTRSTRYEAGNISTQKELAAVKAVSQMESFAQSAATEMLTLDNTPADFNGNLRNNVYLDGSQGNWSGHAVKSHNSSRITRLEAENKSGESISVSVDGDHQEVRYRKEIEGRAGEAPLVEEQWAIFDGSKVKFKAISY